MPISMVLPPMRMERGFPEGRPPVSKVSEQPPGDCRPAEGAGHRYHHHVRPVDPAAGVGGGDLYGVGGGVGAVVVEDGQGRRVGAGFGVVVGGVQVGGGVAVAEVPQGGGVVLGVGGAEGDRAGLALDRLDLAVGHGVGGEDQGVDALGVEGYVLVYGYQGIVLGFEAGVVELAPEDSGDVLRGEDHAGGALRDGEGGVHAVIDHHGDGDDWDTSLGLDDVGGVFIPSTMQPLSLGGDT